MSSLDPTPARRRATRPDSLRSQRLVAAARQALADRDRLHQRSYRARITVSRAGQDTGGTAAGRAA